MLIDNRPQIYISEGWVDTELAILMLEDYMAELVNRVGDTYFIISYRTLTHPSTYEWSKLCL